MRHKWYIVPEMIPLALFDEGLDFYKKDILAKRILTFPRNDRYEARGGTIIILANLNSQKICQVK